MRVFLAVVALLGTAGLAGAGEIADRLGRLEYDSRIQRADVDIMMRQQALDAQDARDRDTKRSEDDQLRRLEQGSGIEAPKPSGAIYR